MIVRYAITFHFDRRTPLRFKGTMPVEKAFALVATLMEANDLTVSPVSSDPPSTDAVDPCPPRSRSGLRATRKTFVSQTSPTPRGDHL